MRMNRAEPTEGTDRLIRVTQEQIKRMYAAVPPDARTGAAVMDALLARVEWVGNATRHIDPLTADCWACAEQASVLLRAHGRRVMGWGLYVCPDCGSKRCMKASDHRKKCEAD